MKTALFSIILGLGLSACVSSDDYTRLERQNQLLTLELDNAKKSRASLERELAAAKANVSALEARIEPLTQIAEEKTKLEEELARKNAEVVGLNEQLQALVPQTPPSADAVTEAHH